LRVEWVRLADENRYGATLRHYFLDQLPGRSPGRDVVGADVATAACFRSVVVLRDDRHLVGDLIEERLLVLRVDDADGDGLHSLVEQIFNNLLLLGGAAAARTAEQHLDVEVAGRLAGTGLGDGPELLRVVGHKANLDLLVTASGG